jgi:hypothetical protein
MLCGVISANFGVLTQRVWFRRYMESLGFELVPGRKWLHELPRSGRLVVEVPGHATAVVNGILRDTYDPADCGLVLVLRYWRLRPEFAPKEAPPKLPRENRWRRVWHALAKRDVPWWAWALLLLCLVAQFALQAAGH